MSYLEEMRPEHYPALYEILKEHDPTFEADSLDHMIACFQELEGWVVVEDEQVIGMVVFSNYQPRLNLIIHAVVHSDCRGRWMTKEKLRLVFGKAYTDLDVPKVSGYMVKGLNDKQLWPIFKKIGFQLEGYVRSGFRFHDKLHDLYLVGMLREECRWIK